MEAVAVAKKKPGPKPDPDRVRSATLMIRCRPEFRAWIERLSEFDRAASMNELMDRALVAYARQVGFKEVAPKR